MLSQAIQEQNYLCQTPFCIKLDCIYAAKLLLGANQASFTIYFGIVAFLLRSVEALPIVLDLDFDVLYLKPPISFLSGVPWKTAKGK